MTYGREQIQHLFQSQFNQTAWTDFIINFFKAQTLRRVPESLDIDQREGQGSPLLITTKLASSI